MAKVTGHLSGREIIWPHPFAALTGGTQTIEHTETVHYSLATIRKLLLAAFVPMELRTFCRERPTFRRLLARFPENPSPEEMVEIVIEYSETEMLLAELLAEVKRAKGAQFARFEAELYVRELGPGNGPSDAPDGKDADEDLWRMIFVPYPSAGGFYVDKYPVTVGQYKRFLLENGRSVAHLPAQNDVPIANLTWEEACEYARYVGKRLPTFEQWQHAAALGHDSIPRYPWGDEWQEGCCNYEGEWRLERPELVSVRKYGPQNPGGVCDIVGNASEMAQDVDAIVQCGGNHNSSKRQIGINKRPFAIARHPVIGFRCVASVEDYEQVVQRK